MRLEPGQRLAHYQILALLGRGGMGEVWRAADTRLGREVALKILPEEFTRDPERLLRFEREARLLASLEHHGIASIHGIEEAGGERFLVMQLAGGEDLSARLARGRLPLDEAIDVARQIAAALEAAHERGVVHRDLKPGNVKIGPGGGVKVLDFGLAFTPDVETETPDDLTNSPTLARGLTGSGVILGTAAYMSPEQARGKRVDRRSDLWALGVVLWEMLTGASLFGGATVSDTIAAVLRSDVDLSKLPPATPPAVRRLLRRCLERDPRKRLADAATARIELEEAAEELDASGSLPAASEPQRRRRALWVVSAAIMFAAAVAGALFLSRKQTTSPAARAGLRVDLSGISFNSVSSVAISPDGETIAYVPYDPTAQGTLHLRSLHGFDSTAIAGTEGAVNPFFSPDGESIGYFTYDALYVVRRQGEAPERIAAVSAQGENGFWTEDGTIFFSGAIINGRRERGISRISATGGIPQPVTKIAAGEIDHRQPFVAGKWLLFTTARFGSFDSAAMSLANGTRRRLWHGTSSPVYSPTGHILLFTPAKLTLVAAPFDLESGEVRGTPKTVVSNVYRQDRGDGAYALSRSGTLVYTPSDAGAARTGAYGLVWVDRNGAVAPIIGRRDSWTQPRVSPDGRTIVVRQTISPNCALWSVDTTRSLVTRLTSRRDYHMPSWHPTGDRILAAVGSGDDRRRLIELAADDSAAERFVSPEGVEAEGGVWSPDGRSIAWVRWSAESGMDLDLMDAASGESRPFTREPYDETSPRFSPDGEWLAYTSNESGVPEVFVRHVSGSRRRIQVSRDGGAGPVWSPDGKEIFFGSRGRLMAVAVASGADLELSVPRELFSGNFVWERPDNFDVSPDGKRFAMIQRSTADSDTELIRVAVGWTDELKRLGE